MPATNNQVDQILLISNIPGAVHPNRLRDFSEVVGFNNVDVFTHWFETLLILHDVTEGEMQDHIAEQIVVYGDFLTEFLYHDQAGFEDRGYVAYNYDENWQPQQIPYERPRQWADAMHATAGHNIELAYLLSRAIERGFGPEWLVVAEKMIRFCQEYALDPETGGMLYDITDYEGQPLEGNPDNPLYLWWPQGETARTFLHYSVVRDVDYVDEFTMVEAFIHNDLTDLEFGAWFRTLDSENDLAPVDLFKGNIWKVNYHYSMFFAEVLRLAQQYPDYFNEG